MFIVKVIMQLIILLVLGTIYIWVCMIS
ncbi:hypothetical protein LINGRAHAP2_LOCUS33818 [Linum grandiflorum]